MLSTVVWAKPLTLIRSPAALISARRVSSFFRSRRLTGTAPATARASHDSAVPATMRSLHSSSRVWSVAATRPPRSCRCGERWALDHAGPVLDQLGAAVEGSAFDHLE